MKSPYTTPSQIPGCAPRLDIFVVILSSVQVENLQRTLGNVFS